MTEPTLTRKELLAKLAVLDQRMGALKSENPESDVFWPAFAVEADQITDGASATDYAWALEKIDAILLKHGRGAKDDMFPSDDLLPT
jgi:hypothetical protein